MPPPEHERENKRGTPRTTLRAVTPEDPCPICGGDHKCSVGDDDNFVLCGRRSGEVEGFNCYGPASGDPQFYIYRRRRIGGEPGKVVGPTDRELGSEPSPDWGRVAAAYEGDLAPREELELASALGLPVEGLLRLGVGYIPKEECWTFPERDAAGRVVGINRRYRDGRKRMMKGGSRGLCYADDWDRADGPILVPEGPSDCATLIALGLPAVGRPSNTGGVDLLVALLQDVPVDRPIVIVGENDQRTDGRWPGHEGAMAIAGGLARRLNRTILVALPTAGTKDVRDWFRQQAPDLEDPASLRKLGRSLVAALQKNAQEVVPWDPILEIHDPELPTFPTRALAPWQWRYVEALAVATQTPVDLAAMLVLTVAAAGAARRAVVRVRDGYDEPLNIYGMVAQPPASRKTSVFREVLQAVGEFEREMAMEARPVVAEARTQLEIDRKTLEEFERKASKAQDEVERATLIEQARTLAQDLAARRLPEVPRWLADDATPESLVNRMFHNGGRIFLASPEGGLFEMIGGRYSQGKTSANQAVYLKGHAGDQIRIDRMNRPPEFIDKPALTIALAVQPDVIHGLASNASFRHRGLLGRFWYSMPRSLVGHRELDPPPVPDVIREEYRVQVRSMLALQPATDEAGEPTEHVIGLSTDAYALWLDFAAWLEPQLGDYGPLSHISDWAGKLAGAVVRIVGLLHLADLAGHEAPWSVPVPGATMVRAIAIGRYLIPHARAAFSEMGADPIQSDARYLLEWIRRSGADCFTRRDAFEATKGHFRQVEAMEPALELLQKQNYIRRRTSPTRSGPGRPIGPAYNVNPAALLGAGRALVPMFVLPLESEYAGCAPGRGLDDEAVCHDIPSESPVADDLPGPTPPDFPIRGDDLIAAEAAEGLDEYEEGII
jgi:hypothetical protein